MFLKPTRGDTEATGKGEDIGNEVAEQTDIIWLRSIQCRFFLMHGIFQKEQKCSHPGKGTKNKK